MGRPQRRSGSLFGEIKDGFLALPTRMYEWGWREEVERYCEQIVALVLLSGSDGPTLSFESARRCLRRIRPEGRKHVIWLLGRVGAEHDDGWRQLVVPFIRKAWPNERRYQTSGTSETWLTLLCDTDDAFPDVFRAVRNHLGAVDAHQVTYWPVWSRWQRGFRGRRLTSWIALCPTGWGRRLMGCQRCSLC